MEKIIVAVDSRNMDISTIGFACKIAKLTGSKLTGIFLEEVELEEEIIYRQVGGEIKVSSLGVREIGTDEDTVARRQENMSLFRELTREKEVEAKIHLDKGVPVAQIIAESRVSDLLIMDAGTTFSGIEESQPTGFVKDVLQDAGCPVIISPERFEGVDNIIFCYDGSKSSLFAMKQFTYLLPEFSSTPVKIISLKEGEAIAKEDERSITEWVKSHYENDVEWLLPYSRGSKAALFEYLTGKKNDFVVMGAYGKGLLRSFFRKDDEVGIKVSALPIFVSHF